MKKLFKLVTLMVVMFFTAAPDLFAADIVVKGVKIKKRQTSSYKINPNQDTCKNKFDIDEMTITTTTETSSKVANYTNFGFAFEVDITKGSIVSSIEMEITLTDCNGKQTIKTIICKYNAITEKYESDFKVPSSKECPVSLSDASITIENPCNKETIFDAKLDVKDKDKFKDSCNTDYKLKEVNYQTQNVFGYYVMSFDFDFGKKGENPAIVEMIVQITNCYGKTLNIKIKLTYDPSTGQYSGTQAIPQDKECPWALTYAEVYGTNPCGIEETWAINFDKTKTNGTGTREGANTVKASKPALK